MGDVGQGHSPPGGQDQVEEITQAAAHPGGQGTRQMAQERGQEAQEEADCFLRSRTISNTMGISDSTMTTTTMMWM